MGRVLGKEGFVIDEAFKIFKFEFYDKLRINDFKYDEAKSRWTFFLSYPRGTRKKLKYEFKIVQDLLEQPERWSGSAKCMMPRGHYLHLLWRREGVA